MITSGVTFLYYQDYQKAIKFFDKTLRLKCIMDQGFARVYEVQNSCFVGIVKTKELDKPGKTLFSFTVDDVSSYYDHIKTCDVKNLTEPKTIESIPLISFFFSDFEGHEFEIQQFLKKEDIIRF